MCYEDAHKIAARISTSALVKTALFGEDAKSVLLSSFGGVVLIVAAGDVSSPPPAPFRSRNLWIRGA